MNEIETESHEFFGTYLENRILELHDPDFYENMIDECAHHLFDDCVCSGYIECDAAALDTNEEYAAILFGEFRQTIAAFAHTFHKMMGLRRRSYKHPKAHHYVNVAKEDLDARLAWIRGAYQPAQRTPEWHLFRHGLISASNIWKAFGTEASVNSLICEKCVPMSALRQRERTASVDDGLEDEVLSAPIATATATTSVNTQSPLHWGVKYEPVTAMIYQKRLNAELGEFGCIQHKEHAFIGASPDGIVVTRDHPAYGRMLEIKNVVNREINGIPSMAYWIQMQVQMEVCNLEECDFVETVFKEYDYTEEDLFYSNAKNRVYEYNGVILYFIKRDYSDSSPKYVYMPMNSNSNLDKTQVNAWIDEQKQAIKEEYVLFKRIYWYCETFSCVLVHRSREWFAAALPKVREVWATIEKERISGCEHRQPKKKKVPVGTTSESKCLIDLSTME
jgi:putative phage-type endonuclease